MSDLSHMQLVTTAFQRWSEGDFASACELFSEDAVWHPQTSYLENRPYKGRAEIEAMLRKLGGHSELSMDFSRMEEVGECVIVHVYARTMGDSEPELQWFQLYAFSDGAINRVEPFDTREAALKEAQG